MRYTQSQREETQFSFFITILLTEGKKWKQEVRFKEGFFEGKKKNPNPQKTDSARSGIAENGTRKTELLGDKNQETRRRKQNQTNRQHCMCERDWQELVISYIIKKWIPCI